MAEPTTCSCHCDGMRARFDSDYVAKKLEKYRQSGPKQTTIILVEAQKASGVQDRTLLDIGGGVGDIPHALLPARLKDCTSVEASPAYAEACQLGALRLGHAIKVQVVVDDFMTASPQIDPADIVTLDRVLCRYHDFRGMLSQSLAKCKSNYGLVYPLECWWIKIGTALYYNLRHWLQRNPFRNFVHPVQEVEALIKQRGFHQVYYETQGGWQVVLYARS